MAVNISTYMSLPIPIVGQEPGPTYAFDVNSCLTIVDSHNHVAGAGQQIPPSGLNINSDLTFLNNNATNLRSVRFQSQGSPLALVSDLGCLYESGVDLYYNDGNGNQIRITQSGSIAGAGGSITGLVSPASATYIPGSTVFVWQSDANVAANMDAGSYIFRNLTVSSFGLTLSPPSLSSNYTITLPTLPATTKILRIDNAGNISSTLDVDNSTIEISSNNLQIKDQGVTAAKIANGTITTTQISSTAGILGSQLSASANIVGTQLSASANVLRSQIEASNLQVSSSCGIFSNPTNSTNLVTNLSVTITTEGKPIVLGLQSDASGNDDTSGLYDDGSSSGPFTFGSELLFLEGATALCRFAICQGLVPASAYKLIFTPSAGTHTYTVQASTVGNHTVNVRYAVLYAYEVC